MKQGEIWLADLNPIKGKEQSGMRPVVLLSGNLLNSHLDIVIVCPVTSQVKNFFGSLVLKPNEENGLKVSSEVLAFHVRAISKQRLIKNIGIISKNEVKVIKSNLDDLLTL